MTSEKHKFLQGQSVRWLETQGYENIHTEVRVNRHNAGKRWAGSFIIDVTAFRSRDLATIALECGGTLTSKLQEISKQFKNIYIWPYGKELPYLWEKGQDVCNDCGNLI